MEVVERRLSERTEATTGCGRREHAIHAIRIVTYLTTVTREKGDRIGTVRPGAVAGAEGLVRERSTGVVRAVRIAGADRITRMMLSIVATPPRVESSVLGSGMLRLLLLLVFLRTIAHCPKQNYV